MTLHHWLWKPTHLHISQLQLLSAGRAAAHHLRAAAAAPQRRAQPRQRVRQAQAHLHRPSGPHPAGSMCGNWWILLLREPSRTQGKQPDVEKNDGGQNRFGIPFWGRCTTHFSLLQNGFEIPFWLVGEFTTHCRTYFSGDWDVHRGYRNWRILGFSGSIGKVRQVRAMF